MVKRMLTKREICQYFLYKAQQKFGKVMTELDVYYANPEVGIALAYLGLIKDKDTLKYVMNNSCVLFKHQNGKEFTLVELLNIIPNERLPNCLIDLPEDEDEIKRLIGVRKYFRLLDAIELIQESDEGLKLFEREKEKKKEKEEKEEKKEKEENQSPAM